MRLDDSVSVLRNDDEESLNDDGDVAIGNGSVGSEERENVAGNSLLTRDGGAR